MLERVAALVELMPPRCGIEVGAAYEPLVLRSRGTLAANDIGGSFTLGVVFVDWSRR